MRITISGGVHKAKPRKFNLANGHFSTAQLNAIEKHVCHVKGCQCKHTMDIKGIDISEFRHIMEASVHKEKLSNH